MPPWLMHAVLDALPERVAVIDESGRIVESNASWRAFAENHDHPLVPADTSRPYLDTLTRSTNGQVTGIASRLRSLLDGKGEPTKPSPTAPTRRDRSFGSTSPSCPTTATATPF
ncbi:hypothetical protein [Haloplanus litoreus]|uniref:PAS domain-containing protein n=1 Tax=Haloplanus litoreus TaxID=767515 RepID=A0ABD6A3T0_9EURY